MPGTTIRCSTSRSRPTGQTAWACDGIARDLAAAGLGTLKPLAQVVAERSPAIASRARAEIRTDDPEGCPAFFGRVIRGVINRASPAWMQQPADRGRPAADLRAGRYDQFRLMLDLGRPRMSTTSPGSTARWSRAGRRTASTCWRSTARPTRSTPTMTVIADDAAVHDIGGIMGGEHSGVTAGHHRRPDRMRLFRSRAYRADRAEAGASTSDARQRFERGVDPAFLADGLTIATPAGARALRRRRPSGMICAPAQPPLRSAHRRLRPRARRMAGRHRDRARAPDSDIFERLGFAVETGKPWKVGVPSWRRDIDGAGRHRRGSRPHPRPRQGALDAAAARAGRRPADRDAGADARTPRCAAPPPRAGSTRR